MYLSGLTHRDRLFDIASRWLADRVHAGDGRVLTEIFVFERAITAPTIRSLVADLARTLREGPLEMRRVSSKDDVRQAIIDAAIEPSPRVRHLLGRYREMPEEFFPSTPVHMSLISRSEGELVGMIRRKRIRRIADKVSSQVADQLAEEIHSAATSLAELRARQSGMHLQQMVSSGKEMADDFASAERIVADRIRNLEIFLDPEQQRVDDLVGIKLLVRPEDFARVEDALDEREGTWALHSKVHDGKYVGTHYLVDLELPPVDRVVSGMRGVDWSFAAGRGVSLYDLESDFYEYVSTGSRSVRVELILTTFEDLVESEFGRSVHEVRILEQRDRAAYSGRIAQNAAWIIEYMLHLAISPTIEVGELPIKIWGRYLRDTLSHAVARLSNGEPVEWLVPDERRGDPILRL
jgi:hypothetical protein